jgi:D-arabinonate dehydratase/D-galactarolactone cycloisomerase
MTGGVGLWNRLDHASPTRVGGYRQALLVKITTDQGLIGWGESHAPSTPRIHQAIVHDLLAPILIGQDARNVEVLWEKMYSAERVRGYSTGFYTEAIAGADIALWDILGKSLNTPIYRLLGGKYRDTAATYTGIGGSGNSLLDNARKAVADGYQVVKMGLSKGQGTNDVARVRQVAEAIQGKGQVLVDSLGAYKLHEAQHVGSQLDEIPNLAWWEDALMPEDVSGYPTLAKQLKAPIVAGEMISNRFQIRDLVSQRAVDIINPDVCRAGGITECKRIAALADAFGVLWSPHVSMGTAVYMAASIHLAVSTSNFVIMEGGSAHLGPLGNPLLKEPLDYKPGLARVPEGPGLGIEFDEAALRKVIAAS